MELKGKLVQAMAVVTGQGQKGTWAKQDFLMEYGDKYPKKVCITLWGQELIDKYDLPTMVGREITAFLEVESRDYQGRWYTNVKAWKLGWEVVKVGEPGWKEPTVEPKSTWTTPKVVDGGQKWPASDAPVDDLPF